MATPKGKTKKAIKETGIERETDGQYLPVQDKPAALDVIFTSNGWRLGQS